MKNIIIKFAFLILIFSIFSCTSNKIYHQIYTFDDYSWNKEEKILFTPEIIAEQANQQYQIIINIRYITGFSLKYLNLGLIINRPDDSQSTKEISIQMMTDEKDYRGSGMGDLWDLDYEINEPITISEAGKYGFEIKSLMGDSQVNFINEIGITLVKIESSK